MARAFRILAAVIALIGFGCSHSHACMTLTGAGGACGGGAAPPTASGWDPSGKGTNLTLSTTAVTNDTATNSANTANMVRGTSCKTTGKWAFEIKILSLTSALMFGLIDQTTTGGANLTGVFHVPNGIIQWDAGTVFLDGADFTGTTVASWTSATNDILGVQVDLTAGKVWLSRNGSSMAGNPVAGTGNLLSIANNHLVCPAASIFNTGDQFQLITGTLNTPIAGFSSWGP